MTHVKPPRVAAGGDTRGIAGHIGSTPDQAHRGPSEQILEVAGRDPRHEHRDGAGGGDGLSEAQLAAQLGERLERGVDLVVR